MSKSYLLYVSFSSSSFSFSSSFPTTLHPSPSFSPPLPPFPPPLPPYLPLHPPFWQFDIFNAFWHLFLKLFDIFFYFLDIFNIFDLLKFWHFWHFGPFCHVLTLFDMFWHFFDSFRHFFYRQTDSQNLDVEALTRSLKMRVGYNHTYTLKQSSTLTPTQNRHLDSNRSQLSFSPSSGSDWSSSALRCFYFFHIFFDYFSPILIL